MRIGGIGKIAIDEIAAMYELFRDAYCKVIQGMPYETYRQLKEAIEKTSIE